MLCTFDFLIKSHRNKALGSGLVERACTLFGANREYRSDEIFMDTHISITLALRLGVRSLLRELKETQHIPSLAQSKVAHLLDDEDQL